MLSAGFKSAAAGAVAARTDSGIGGSISPRGAGSLAGGARAGVAVASNSSVGGIAKTTEGVPVSATVKPELASGGALVTLAPLPTCRGSGVASGIGTTTRAPQSGQIARFPAKNDFTLSLCPFGHKKRIPIAAIRVRAHSCQQHPHYRQCHSWRETTRLLQFLGFQELSPTAIDRTLSTTHCGAIRIGVQDASPVGLIGHNCLPARAIPPDATPRLLAVSAFRLFRKR